MATREQKYYATIEINAQQAHSEIKRLEAEKEKTEKAIMDLSRKHDKESKAQRLSLQHDLKDINRQLSAQRKYAAGLDTVLSGLSKKTYKDLENEVRQLNKMMRDGTIEKGTKEWDEMAEHIRRCKREMKEYTAAVQEVPKEISLWKRGADFLNKNWGAITQMIGAISGLSVTIRNTVRAYAEMQQEMANVRKYTGQTAEEVERMNEDFEQMDTRTSREELNQLAGAAGRLGITQTKMVEEFVDGADKIRVALGDDLGEGAVDTIGKLAIAFGEDKKKGLRGAMLATGSALNELVQSSPAQAQPIIEFTSKLSGVGQQAHMTQAQIMGLGAALDQNNQEMATSSTVISQLITKMYQDPARFAKMAGMEVDAFTKKVKEDMNGALVEWLQNVNKLGDMSVLAEKFDKLKMDGTRAVGVLATLAAHVDQVVEAQRTATEAYNEGISVTKEFNIQNETEQAQTEKAKKHFHDLAVELGQQLMPVVKYTISSSSMLVKGLSAIIKFVTQHKILIVSLAAEITILNARRLYGISLAKAETLWNGRVASSIKAIGTAIRANPWGIAITALTAFIALLTEAVDRTKKNAAEMTALGRAHKRAAADFDTERGKIDLLNKMVHNNKISYEQRKEALDKLKEIVPGYLADLDKEKGLVNDNTDALTEYLTQLEKSIKMKAAQEELEEAYRKKRKLERQETTLSSDLKDAETGLAAAQFSASQDASRLGTAGTQNLAKGMDVATLNAQSRVNDVKGQLKEVHKELEQTEKDITQLNDEIVSTSAEISKLKPAEKGGDDNSSGGTTEDTGGDDEKKRKKQEQEFKRQLKERAEAAKASWQEQLACEMLAYQQGISSYTNYMEEKHNLTQNYYDELKRIYGEDSNEYKKALLQQARDEQEYNSWKIKQDDDSLLRDKLETEHRIRMQYAQQTVRDDRQMNEALFQNEIAYLKKKRNLYKDGSKEQMDIDMKIVQKENQHKYEKEKEWAKLISKYKAECNQLDYDALLDMELKGIESVHEMLIAAGQLTEEEYTKIIENIKRKYAELKAEQATNSDVRSQAAGALDMAKKGTGTVQSDAGDNIATGAFSIVQAIENQQLINDELERLYSENAITHEQYEEAKRQASMETMQSIVSGAQAAYNTINSLLSAASSYAQACSDLELAKITKNYDRQIKAAGNNEKKKQKLEEERDKKIRDAKNKANKRAMAIEMAQAIATTALTALQAYQTGMQAGYPAGLVLGPVAAGLALAAGAIQIATIKKAHEAEAEGYYEGGFTGGHRYRKEAGVVHEGEFVANHQAVNNPQLMPVLSLIDQAQRNNRVGQLRAEDVTNVMGGAASAAVVAPVVNVTSDNSELREGLEALQGAVDTLNVNLEDGLGLNFVFDGPNGFDAKYRQFKKLKS